LLLLLLALGPAARAQDYERPDFEMSCAKAVKLGLGKFMDVYGKQTEDYSTAGQKWGFKYWADCKRPANDALAARILSEARRKQVEAAREEFNRFGMAIWELKYLEAGGGTMWGLISVGSYAEREKFMETFIRTLAAPARRSPRARRLVNTSLARIQRWLSASSRKPFTEGSEPEQVSQNKKYYAETLQETQAILAKLRDLLKELPDVAAARLAAKMASETRDALADTQ
jgi:hypothetical protein